MTWYLAKLVFRIVCNNNTGVAQFDEQIWLFTAIDREEALEKAKTKGNNEEISFTGAYTGKVKWEFVEVTDLQSIEELKDGISLISRIEETDDPNGYLTTLHRKAENLSAQTVYSV